MLQDLPAQRFDLLERDAAHEPRDPLEARVGEERDAEERAVREVAGERELPERRKGEGEPDQQARVLREERRRRRGAQGQSRRETPVREQVGVVVAEGPIDGDARDGERREREPEPGEALRARHEQARHREREHERAERRVADGSQQEVEQRQAEREIDRVHRGKTRDRSA